MPSIERIAAPNVADFWHQYMMLQQPVILTDLYEGQPIRQIDTLALARQRLGAIRLIIQEEYTSSVLRNSFHLKGNFRQQQERSLEEYFHLVTEQPDTPLMCTETATPQEVRSLFKFPEYCQLGLGLDDAVSMIFVGNAGNYAHLHFDGDYRHVLLYQVFGTKRVILIPPGEAKKLNPIANSSTWFPENFSESDKQAFVQFANGYDCVLHPGEAIFIPACWWHHLEYQTAAMSFNVRFGRNTYTHFLADKLPINFYVQNLAAAMNNAEIVEQRYLSEFRHLEAAYHQAHLSGVAKGKYLQELVEKLYKNICTGSQQGMYAFTNFDALTDQLLALESQDLYQPPTPLSSLVMGWSALSTMPRSNT